MKDLTARYIDSNCLALNNTISFVGSAVEGEVIVLVNDNSAGNDKIIAASGINSVRKFEGKRIAVEAEIADDFVLSLASDQENLFGDDVKIIDLGIEAAVETFVAGHRLLRSQMTEPIVTVGQIETVGAFALFWLTALQRYNISEIIFSKAFAEAIPDLLTVTKKLVYEHSENVQFLINTRFDIFELMTEQPTKADRIIVQRAEAAREEFRLFPAGTKIFTAQNNLEAFKKGNNIVSMPYAARKVTHYLRNSLKSIERKPDLSKIFNNSFIEFYVF